MAAMDSGRASALAVCLTAPSVLGLAAAVISVRSMSLARPSARSAGMASRSRRVRPPLPGAVAADHRFERPRRFSRSPSAFFDAADEEADQAFLRIVRLALSEVLGPVERSGQVRGRLVPAAGIDGGEGREDVGLDVEWMAVGGALRREHAHRVQDGDGFVRASELNEEPHVQQVEPEVAREPCAQPGGGGEAVRPSLCLPVVPDQRKARVQIAAASALGLQKVGFGIALGD